MLDFDIRERDTPANLKTREDASVWVFKLATFRPHQGSRSTAGGVASQCSRDSAGAGENFDQRLLESSSCLRGESQIPIPDVVCALGSILLLNKHKVSKIKIAIAIINLLIYFYIY